MWRLSCPLHATVVARRTSIMTLFYLAMRRHAKMAFLNRYWWYIQPRRSSCQTFNPFSSTNRRAYIQNVHNALRTSKRVGMSAFNLPISLDSFASQHFFLIVVISVRRARHSAMYLYRRRISSRRRLSELRHCQRISNPPSSCNCALIRISCSIRHRRSLLVV